MPLLAAIARWTIALIIGVSVLFLVLLTADAARAQPLQCTSLDSMVTHLTEKYQEQLIGNGEGPNGTRMLLCAHPDGATWTVVGVLPDGQACFIASGANWSVHDFTPAGSET